jgi:predicted MFS family arabinose efflux permease
MNKTPLSLAMGGLLAMAATIGVGRFVYTPILPPMVEALGLTKSEAGFIASANFMGYFVGALLASVRLPGSHRSWLIGALLVNVAALAAMGLVSSLFALSLVRFTAGLVSAFGLIFSSALVLVRLVATRHDRLSAVHFAGVGAGIALSAALVSVLHDWRTMWFASAALASVASVLAVALVPPDHPGSALPTSDGRAPLPAGFMPLAIAYGLTGFGYIITATFIVAMVRSTPTLTSLESYIWVIFGLSAAPSVALWTSRGPRWGIRRTFAIAAFVEAAGVAGSALWINPATVIAASVFVGITFVGLTALGLIAAREGGGDPRRRIALMTAAFSTGQILGPVFAGHLYDRTGSLSLPSLIAAAALAIAGLLTVRRHGSSDRQTP